MSRESFQRTFLLVLVVAISLIFFTMIRNFFITLLLAGIFSGLLHPFYERLLTPFRERRALASLCTILVFVLAVVIPVLAILGIVVGQAVNISRTAAPWIEQQIRQPDRLYEWLRNLPGFDFIAPYRDQILSRLAAIAGDVGNYFVRGLSAATTGTVAFFFQFFIFLYALFFFLMDGDSILRKILYYLPLSSKDEDRLVDRFSSVTRATIKGTLVVGIVQGGMAGVGLAVAGIGGAVFWGTVMVILSIIPGIGTALVWAPAVIYLIAVGKVLPGILLAVYCALVVGSVDNLLRPRLVGKDIKMSDLMVLLGTLGGLMLFGLVGFILGPVIVALFVTIWDIYGRAFDFALAEPAASGRRQRPAPHKKSTDSRGGSPPRRGASKPRDRSDSRGGADSQRRPGDDGPQREDKRQRGTRRRRTGSHRRSQRRPGEGDRD
jgi:predicted PurR-regulated permease PerM